MGWADVDWLRGIGYLAVAAICVAVWRREDHSAVGYWPPFWLLIAALLAAMGIGRLGGLGDLVGDYLRDWARGEGWYADRRRLQALVVVAIGIAWTLFVLAVCTQTAERRRRYLPMTLIVLTIVAFLGVRTVSLHQIDSALHHHHVVGMRVGTVVEYGLLTLALAYAIRRTAP